MRELSRFAAAVLTVAAVAVSAEAATIHVATSGKDSNSGTLSAPLATITRAAALARPGDEVHVRGGVYYEVVKISSKGTATSPIVIRSYPGEKAIIDGSESASNTNLVQISGAEYLEFRGFEVRNATRIGICGWGGRFVRVIGNTIHDTVKGGIWFGYDKMGYTSDLTINSNTVYRTVLENQYHTSATGWSQAIGLQHTQRASVRMNTVYENDGEGIAIILSDNAVVARNRVSDNYAVNIYLDNARYTVVDANFVYSTGNTRYYRNSYPAHGIGMANEAYATSNPLTDIKVVNNIVLNSRWGIYYGNYENGGGLKNTVVANNTVFKATHSLLNIDSSAHSNSYVQNNVFFQSGGGHGATVAGGGVSYRNNGWHGGSAGAAAGSGDFIGDPKLVNAGGMRVEDYRLTAQSPLLLKGVATAGVKRDYWQTLRPSKSDVGAHQLSTNDYLLARNRSTGNLIWYGMTGSTLTRTIESTGVSGSQWQAEVLADFNGDQNPDIIWRNYDTGAVSVWFMNGTTYVGGAELYNVADPAWRIEAAADFNGDGSNDLIWRNYATGSVNIWYLDGTRYVSGRNLFNVADKSWEIRGADDFNSDGHADLVWRNRRTGDVNIWYLQDGAWYYGENLFNVADPAWDIVAAGDYSGDGSSDLVWQNSASGAVNLWRLEGGRYVGGAQLFSTTHEVVGPR